MWSVFGFEMTATNLSWIFLLDFRGILWYTIYDRRRSN